MSAKTTLGQLYAWLSRPYPLIEGLATKSLMALGFGLFTYLFLLLFQPFGGQAIQDKVVVLAGFGLSVTGCLTFSYLILPKLVPQWFRPASWQIKNEVLFLVFNLLLTSVANYYYNLSVDDIGISRHSLFGFVGITSAVGFFPILIMLFLVELLLSRSNGQLAFDNNRDLIVRTKQPEEGKPLQPLEGVPVDNGPPQRLTINGEGSKTRPFEILVQDFLYAVSDGNYMTFYYLDKTREAIKSHLVRITIKDALDQTKGIESVYRCHKSYLVNLIQAERFEGNARSMYIVLRQQQKQVPVSRSLVAELKDRLAGLA